MALARGAYFSRAIFDVRLRPTFRFFLHRGEAGLPAGVDLAFALVAYGQALGRRLLRVGKTAGRDGDGCSRMPSLPSFKMALATVSIRTPFSTKKCRPAGNDIAVVMSLQQGSNDFSGSDNCASPALDYSRCRRPRRRGRRGGWKDQNRRSASVTCGSGDSTTF